MASGSATPRALFPDSFQKIRAGQVIHNDRVLAVVCYRLYPRDRWDKTWTRCGSAVSVSVSIKGLAGSVSWQQSQEHFPRHFMWQWFGGYLVLDSPAA